MQRATAPASRRGVIVGLAGAALVVAAILGGLASGSHSAPKEEPGPTVVVVSPIMQSTPVTPEDGPGAGVEPSRATPISGERGQVIAANFDGGIDGSGQTLSAPTLWWRWEVPRTGTYVFTTSSSEFDTVLTAYTGEPGALSVLAANDDNGDVQTSAVTLTVDAGDAVFLAVTSKTGATGLAILAWAPQS